MQPRENQPPTRPELRRGDRGVSFRPRFAWAERNEEGRRERITPAASAVAAAEAEDALLELLAADDRPLPPKGTIAARILHVLEHMPGEDQEVVALLKTERPYWGVTTRRVR